MEVLFATKTTGKMQTKAVKGDYTAREAVDQMLDGTGLTVAQDAKTGAFTISSGPNAPRAALERSSDRPAKSDIVEGKLILDKFEVMGSKLLNMDKPRSADDAQPYVTFGRDTIERSAAISIEDFLRSRLSMNTQAGTDSLDNLFVGAGTTSSVNLRGLGPNQTLILIDGRRAPTRFNAQGGVAQPDLNGIPLAAVERIEVLPTTASGIYGGSATGGVVNVVLRRDYAGMEVKLSYENTFDTDAAIRRVDLSAGLTLEDGKTNVLMSASWSDSHTLALQDRDHAQQRRFLFLANNNGNYLSIVPAVGSTPNIVSATGATLTLKPQYGGASLNSTITHVPVGYTGVASDNGAALVANAGKYNLLYPDNAAPFGGGQSTVWRAPALESLMLTARRQFSPWLQLFADYSASNNISRSPSSGSAQGSFTIPASVATNPFNQNITVRAPFFPATGELFNETRTWHATGGAIVKLPGEWMAEADYSWSRNYGIYRTSPAAPAAFATAVTSGALDILRDTGTPPIDPAAFGTGLTSYSATPPRLTAEIVTLRGSGPIPLELPAGRATLSGLVETRRESTTDGYFASGTTLADVPARSQSVESAYLEALVPIISDRNKLPFVQSLELQIAGRHDRYKTNGVTGTTTGNITISHATNIVQSTDPAIALKFQPADFVTVRASYGTGFLSPNVSQLIRLTTGVSAASILDPRRGSTSFALANGQIANGGNPDLQPEESESWSSGLIFTPRQVPGLRVSLDYTRIKKQDNITTLSLQQVLDNESAFPDRVVRGANLPGDLPGWAGPVTFLDASAINASTSEVEAFDLQLSYRKKTAAAGTWEFITGITRQTHLKTRVAPTTPEFETVGYGNTGVSGNPLKLRGNAGLTWSSGPWTLGWAGYYYDSYFVYSPTSAAATIAAQVLSQGSGGRVASQNYHDLTATYRFGVGAHRLSGLELTAGVKNIFNRAPPYDAVNTFLGYYSRFGDPRMAAYFLSVKKTF